MGKDMRIIDLIMKVPNVEIKPLLSRLMKTKRSTVVIILLLVAVPAVFLSYGFVHMVGTQKIYCLNCHVNQRNMGFWKKSAVHPEISCATCHDVDKGAWNAAFHFSFSAKDDVMAGHCMGCHKKDIDRPVGIDADPRGRPENELIRIPHARHIMEFGIKCTYCHENVYHERRSGKFATYRPTMEVCYTCHDEKKAACDSCHPRGVPSTASLSGKVGGGKISYSPMGAGEVVFNHKRHVRQGLDCDSCHNTVFKMSRTKGVMTMARMYAGKDCGYCHNGKGAFASTKCERCHKGGVHGGGDIAYPGGGSGKVLFSHDRHMKMGLKCEECHTGLFGYSKHPGKMTMDMMNGGKVCGKCHNGKKAFAADDCAKCHQMG
jgi:c(7)-type cytochrome triheme protein